MLLTVDSSRAKIYVDGQLANDTSYGANRIAGGTLVFGQDQDQVGGGFQVSQAFQGIMDDIRVFDRVLTAEEIQIEYSLHQTSEWRYGSSVSERREDNNEVTRAVDLCTTPNNPPVIGSTPITTVEAGASYTYPMQTTDADGDGIAYALLLSTHRYGVLFRAAANRVGTNPRPGRLP